MSISENNPSDVTFLYEMEKGVDRNSDEVTDFEWDLRKKQWDEEKNKIYSQMLRNTIWNMSFSNKNQGQDEYIGEDGIAYPIESSNTFLNDGRSVESKVSKPRMPVQTAAMSNASRIQWKVPKLSRLELFKYLAQWDKSSFGQRDTFIMEFVRTYKTKEKVYDTDHVFCYGGSLIFCRFAVGLNICFLKHRKVWHYYEALGVFAKSLQSDRYAEEFLRLGGMNCLIQVVRVEESGRLDKLHACKFLVDLMQGRNGHAVKQFICDTPHFLESLVDSLTMCKDKKLIESCGLIFQNLCIEIPPPNIPMVCNFVMHALPCDFNPMLQSMAFKVLQSLIRLRPSLATKCIKPILDNLKTDHSELLVEMSNLSFVILQTPFGSELISALMVAGEGIQLREVFRSIFRPHMQKAKGQTAKDVTQEMKKMREKREKARVKQIKFDHYMHQAGALFVLNRMMTNKVEFVNDFINKGIFGLSLKTLGACPHWEVQGQGVTMVQYLHSVSMDCALSYYMMLPPRMIELILEKPEECLRYFTSPICVFLRKLGRFALRMWPLWVEKVVSVARLYGTGANIPMKIFEMSQMAKKVYEIHNAMEDLLNSPVMEAVPKSPRQDEKEGEEAPAYIRDFLDSDDEENLVQYKDGKDVIMGDSRFESFKSYLDDQDYRISDDRLDARVDSTKPSVLVKDDETKELDAYQIVLLEEAEKEKSQAAKKSLLDDPHQLEEVEGEGAELELTNRTLELPVVPDF